MWAPAFALCSAWLPRCASQAGKCHLVPSLGAEMWWEEIQLPSPSLPLQQQTYTSCCIRRSPGGFQPSRRELAQPQAGVLYKRIQESLGPRKRGELLKPDNQSTPRTGPWHVPDPFCVIDYCVSNIWMVLETGTKTISCFFQLSAWRRPQTKGHYQHAETSWLWWRCPCASTISSALGISFFQLLKGAGCQISKEIPVG